jgi:hypothetical protein
MYFDGVRLPATAGNFSSPPTARVRIAGEELDVAVPEFAPLDVRISTHQGLWASEVVKRTHRVFVRPRVGGAVNPDDAFTLVYSIKGLGVIPWDFRFIDVVSGRPLPEAKWNMPASGQAHASSVGGLAGYQGFLIPLQRIQAIDIATVPFPAALPYLEARASATSSMSVQGDREDQPPSPPIR